MTSIIVLLVFGLSFSQSAFAYLDPGTGSFILQMLIAGVLGALATIKFYWYRLKRFFVELFGQKVGDSRIEKTKSEDLPPED